MSIANRARGAWNEALQILPKGWTLFGQNDRETLTENTQELRNLASTGRAIRTQLERTPPTHPNQATLAAQLRALDRKLASKYGYTSLTAPKPGSLFIDPQFLRDELICGKVTGTQFPVGNAVTAPPSAMDALFAGGRSVQVKSEGGALLTLKTPTEYQAFVARHRKTNGMPREGGVPIAAQFVFQGGAGKGKRASPVVAEMIRSGVVPVSVSGASAGALAAAMLAGGANPAELERLASDPRLSKLMDLNLRDLQGGLMDGQALYEYVDQSLRELTGIRHRPVTFADLRLPLQVLATKMFDSAAAGPMDTVESRKFVFSQSTTPNTPVALAVRASAAIPGVFDPVQMIDPMTGQQLMLTDGGMIDALPMGLGHPNLPVVGVTLQDRNENHPKDKNNTRTTKRMPTGNANVGNYWVNALFRKRISDQAAVTADDFRDRSRPRPGQFMLGVPTWDLNDPSRRNKQRQFAYEPKLDPVLDQQSVAVTRGFLREFLDDMGDPRRSGTNAHTTIPNNLSFTRDVTIDGKRYVVQYAGGDRVTFRQFGGPDTFSAKLGRQKIEAMWLDDLAYGDLAPKLRHAAGRRPQPAKANDRRAGPPPE